MSSKLFRLFPTTTDENLVFNDALGTTVGAKKDGKYSAAALTAFGEDLSVNSSGESSRSPFPVPHSPFFTGKPYVEGLGHAFLMRNYRAGLAKWQSADPMGYPDGWNALAYCNNDTINCGDFLGAVLYTSEDSINAANNALGNAMRVAKEQEMEIGDNHYYNVFSYVYKSDKLLPAEDIVENGIKYRVVKKEIYGDEYQEYYAIAYFLKSKKVDGGIMAINALATVGGIVINGTAEIALTGVGVVTSPRDVLNAILGNRVTVRLGDGYKLTATDKLIDTIEVSRTKVE